MKKFISLITSGILTVMSVMPLTVTAESKVLSVSEPEITAVSVANKSDSQDISLATTPATVSDSELTAVFARSEESYNVYVGEEIDLNSIVLNLYVYGYSPDGNFIPEPILLNYSFSLGSDEHSDCYNYYLDYVDTSKAGRYLIQCKLKGGVKETFDIENSGCPDIPDGRYEMTMSNANFAIPINVIEPTATKPESHVVTTATTDISPIVTEPALPSVVVPVATEIADPTTTETTFNVVTTTVIKSPDPIVTEPTSPSVNVPIATEVADPTATETTFDEVTTTAIKSLDPTATGNVTTAAENELQTVTQVLQPVKDNEIRAMYTCQETYTVSVGEKFNPDDIELSVYARSTVPNQYQIDYRFTIGSGKHSDCFIYDASEVDTSKAGTYYVKIMVLPDVKDTYMIDSSNSYNVPEGEYEMITEAVQMFITVPVYVKETARSVSVIGDANGDGKINMSDATAIIQHISNKDRYGLSSQGLANADTNNDGKVTSSDAVIIQMFITEQVAKLPYIE